MLKKTLVVGAGALLLLALIFNAGAWSYVSTTCGWVKDTVKENVPVEFEIERARQMIRGLEPEIEHNMRIIAKEEMQVEKLLREVGNNKEELTDAREKILRLKADLDSASSTYVYAGRTYSEKTVKQDLANRFERFKTAEATTAKLEKILEARQRGLLAAQDNLEAMLSQKKKLEVDIENLEARLKLVKVAQTNSEINLDNSHLARTKELMEDIGSRITVAEKLVNANTKFHEEIPLDEEPTTADNITDQITDYFGDKRPEIEAYVGSLED